MGDDFRGLVLVQKIKRIAAIDGTIFMDAGEHAHCSPVDGIHIDDSDANRIGIAIAASISARFTVDDSKQHPP